MYVIMLNYGHLIHVFIKHVFINQDMILYVNLYN